jgi:hypothetical protein
MDHDLYADVNMMEFDYFASDLHGNLALFSSAGFGWIPNVILENRDDHEYMEFGEETSDVVDLVDRSLERYEHFEMPPEFLEAAKCGLYVYNWAYDGSYVLVLRPTNPSHLSSLSEEHQRVFTQCVFDAYFSKTPILK